MPTNRDRLTRRDFSRKAAVAAIGMGVGLGAAAADRETAGMKITIVGDGSCIPDVGRETACFLIDGKHLVDTGWCAALRMRQYGFDPLRLESLIFTHFHQDHYLGLPQLLFYIGMQKRKGPPLRLIGPDEHLKQVVEAALAFLQVSRFPEIAPSYTLVPLAAGDSFECQHCGFRRLPPNTYRAAAGGNRRWSTGLPRRAAGHASYSPAIRAIIRPSRILPEGRRSCSTTGRTRRRAMPRVLRCGPGWGGWC